jgi:Zn-dependent M28 family amino/carboxypeptidase
VKTFVIWFLLFLVFIGLVGAFSTCFPGTNPVAMRPGTDETTEMADSLKAHVDFLTADLGARDKPNAVEDAALYMAAKLGTFGPEVKQVDGAGGKTLVGEVTGSRYAKEVVLVCSHFDGPRGSPGADAGASGAAVLLEVARSLAATGHERTLRFVLFPDGAARAGKPDSAAAQYAKDCASKGEQIVAVVYIDSVGLFADKDTQSYPFPLMLAYPGKADFIGIVGAFGSRDLTSQLTEYMRGYSGLPAYGFVMPAFTPGSGFSPHAAFWSEGFPAAVVTDTGSYRSPLWGTASDTPDRLDYPRMARVALGLIRTVGQLVKKVATAV